MAANSFQVKAWAMALFSGIIAFTLDKLVNQQSPALGIGISLLLLVPIVSFWWLDAFFLHTEQLYRKLYKWVVQHRMLNQDAYLYDLNTFERETKLEQKDENGNNVIKTETISIASNKTVGSVMVSPTIWRFYLSPLVFIALLFSYNLLLLLGCISPTFKSNENAKQHTEAIASPAMPQQTKDSVKASTTPTAPPTTKEQGK